MPKNNVFTRHVTGAYLKSQHWLETKLKDNEEEPENPIYKNFRIRSGIQEFLEIFDKEHRTPVKFKNGVAVNNSKRHQNNSVKKIQIKLDVTPPKDAAVLNSKHVGENILNISTNVGVRTQLKAIINNQRTLIFNSITDYLENNNFSVRDTQVTLVLEQGDNDDVFITKTVKKEIFSTKSNEAVTHNFYTVSTVIHITPDKDSVVDGKKHHNSNCSIESVEETVNTSSLESKAKKFEKDLGDKEKASSIINAIKQGKFITADHKKDVPEKAAYLSLYNEINEYITAQQLMPLVHFDNVKQVFSGLTFDQEKFKASIIFLAGRNDDDDHDIDRFFSQFTTLQLVKIHRAIHNLAVSSVKEKEDLKKIATKLGDILVARKVSPYLKPDPEKDIEKAVKTTIKNTVLQIKNCLTSSYLLGRNIHLMFTNSKKVELSQQVISLGKILIGEILDTKLSRNIVENSECYSHIKNTFILYFKSSELCELYKKIAEGKELFGDQYNEKWFDAIKEVIRGILKEREIKTEYYDYKSSDIGSQTSQKDEQTGDHAVSTLAAN